MHLLFFPWLDAVISGFKACQILEGIEGERLVRFYLITRTYKTIFKLFASMPPMKMLSKSKSELGYLKNRSSFNTNLVKSSVRASIAR